MFRKNPILCVAAMNLLALVSVQSLVAAADVPDAVKKVQTTISGQAKTILRVAHPLGKFTECAFDDYRSANGKHELTYTITWNGKEEKQQKEFSTSFAFLFTFDQEGAIADMEISVPKDTCKSKAFQGADIAARIFRAQVKKRLQDVSDDEELLKKLKTMDADALLAVWIKYADKKPKK